MMQEKHLNRLPFFQEKLRDEYGALIFDNLSICQLRQLDATHFDFVYQGDKYYMKKCRHINGLYNELIAQELAHDYGLKCAYTDIVFLDGDYYIISANMHSIGDSYIPIDKLFDEGDDRFNNLTDIWNKFAEIYQDEKIVYRLMEQLVDIFMFDILIANADRHMSNYGIIQSINGISLNYIFDNENMLDPISIYEGGYSIGIERSDYFIFENDGVHFLEKFLNVSDKFYYEYFKEKLDIISEENILRVFQRIEDKIGCLIHFGIKKQILNKFIDNRQVIERIMYKFNKCR